MKKKGHTSFSAFAAAVGCLSLLTGCQAMNTAESLYSNARAGMTAKSAFISAKDMKDATTAFAGYNYASALASVTPRKDSPQFVETFRQNLLYLIAEDAKAIRAPLTPCPVMGGQCAGRTVVIQFREDAYNSSTFEKLTMGDKLKGTLTYSDAATGQILVSKKVEGVDSYEGLMGLINGNLSATMLKSFPPASSDAMKSAVDALNQVKPIRSGYETAFKAS